MWYKGARKKEIHMRENTHRALPRSQQRGTCPHCSKVFNLVFADEQKRDALVLPEHYIMPKTNAEARLRNQPLCQGSKKSVVVA